MRITSLIKNISRTGLVAYVLVLPAIAAAYSQSPYYSQGTYYSESTYYGQGTYQITFTKNATMTGTGTGSGSSAAFNVTGRMDKGSGTFLIDHPLDPKNKLLYHSFVESPDVKNIYDGIATLDAKGSAVIRLPSYFMALNQDFRYQLRSIGTPQPNLYVSARIEHNRFSIRGGSPGGKVSWQVTGIRHDAYILSDPIIPEVMKSASTSVPRGTYLHPDIYPDSPFDPLVNLWQWLSDLVFSK